jgi:hypothetical protein
VPRCHVTTCLGAGGLAGVVVVMVEAKNPKPKPSSWSSVSVNKTRGVLDFNQGDGNGVGYAVVEGLRGGERARRGVGWFWAGCQKWSRQGLVSANETWGMLDLV